ncbi:MAG: PEGA domain-containing protein [Myxococcales bacterium]|nr:PEGA domain-containing protein [Myxococcales bacterium]
MKAIASSVFFALLASTLAASASAQAPAPIKIAVMPTDALDPVPPAIGDALRERMRLAIAEVPELVDVGGVQMTPEEARMTFSCFDESPECMSELAGAVSGAQRIAWARIERRDMAWQLRVRVLDFKERRYTQDQSFTLPGGDERVAELALLAAGVVRGERPEVALTSRLIIDSDPPGADVMVDGRQLGPAPQTVEVTQGRHAIELSLPGRRTVKREVDVGPREQRELIRLPIVPKVVEATPVAEPTHWSTWAGIGALVVAGVAAGVGGYALVQKTAAKDDAERLNADAAAFNGLDDRTGSRALADEIDRRWAAAEDDYAAANTLATAAWITAGVAAAAGVYLLVLHDTDDGAVVTPSVSAEGAGAAISIRF